MAEDKIWKGVGECKHSTECELLHNKLKEESATSTNFYETCPGYIAVKNWFEKKGYLEKKINSLVYPASMEFEVRFEETGSRVSILLRRYQPNNYCYFEITGDLAKVKEKGRVGVVMKNIANKLGELAE